MSKSNTVWSGSVAAVLHLGVFSDQLLMRLMVILSTRVAGGGGGGYNIMNVSLFTFFLFSQFLSLLFSISIPLSLSIEFLSLYELNQSVHISKTNKHAFG